MLNGGMHKLESFLCNPRCCDSVPQCQFWHHMSQKPAQMHVLAGNRGCDPRTSNLYFLCVYGVIFSGVGWLIGACCFYTHWRMFISPPKHPVSPLPQGSIHEPRGSGSLKPSIDAPLPPQLNAAGAEADSVAAVSGGIHAHVHAQREEQGTIQVV